MNYSTISVTALFLLIAGAFVRSALARRIRRGDRALQ